MNELEELMLEVLRTDKTDDIHVLAHKDFMEFRFFNEEGCAGWITFRKDKAFFFLFLDEERTEMILSEERGIEEVRQILEIYNTKKLTSSN